MMNVKTMVVNVGGIKADYVMENGEIKVVRVYRGDVVYSDSRMFDLAKWSIRGQLDKWMHIPKPKKVRS
jgi:hypothetical protein